MKNILIILGAILILVGVVGFAMGGFSFTQTKRVVDIGPLKVDAQEEKSFPIPPAVSLVILAGGAALVVGGAMSKK